MNTVNEDRNDWQRIAAALAEMESVVPRLLAEHIDDGHGHCMACTAPGTGLRSTPWPCALTKIAVMAQAIQQEQDAESHREEDPK